jgi:hypothetical protein
VDSFGVHFMRFHGKYLQSLHFYEDSQNVFAELFQIISVLQSSKTNSLPKSLQEKVDGAIGIIYICRLMNVSTDASSDYFPVFNVR